MTTTSEPVKTLWTKLRGTGESAVDVIANDLVNDRREIRRQFSREFQQMTAVYSAGGLRRLAA
jgi:hypothetical protein